MKTNFTTLDTRYAFSVLEALWDDHDNDVLEVFENNPEHGVFDKRWDEYESLDFEEYCEKRDSGELAGKFVRLTANNDNDVDSVLEVVKATLTACGKLRPEFEITIHEFRERRLLDDLERESRARGFSSCKTRDDDGERRYYLDDRQFVKEVGECATSEEAFRGDVYDCQLMVKFLRNGGAEPAVTVFDEGTQVASYGVTYRFNVDWESFDWDAAACEYIDGEFGENVAMLVGLFDEV